MQNFGEEPQALDFDIMEPTEDEQKKDTGKGETSQDAPQLKQKVVPPKQDEFLWAWKVFTIVISPVTCFDATIPQPELETTRRTFFL